MIISGTCVKHQNVSSCKHKHLKYQNKSHLQTAGIPHNVMVKAKHIYEARHGYFTLLRHLHILNNYGFVSNV